MYQDDVLIEIGKRVLPVILEPVVVNILWRIKVMLSDKKYYKNHKKEINGKKKEYIKKYWQIHK